MLITFIFFLWRATISVLMSPQAFSIKDSLLVRNIQLMDSRAKTVSISRRRCPCAIHKADAPVRYPCASCSLRHNNAMWPICLSSLALAVLTAGIVQGAQSGQCVFKPDSVSPLQRAFIAAFEPFLCALKITQCTDEHALLKAEIWRMLVMVLLRLNGFEWVIQTKGTPSALFWKLKLKFQFRPSTVCVASLARKLMRH